ncbi:MAG TPA: hypothetical protein GXZ65_01795 [Clostridiales bacterium]|nr:hypothetical protein [Clostridiales bacterium]
MSEDTQVIKDVSADDMPHRKTPEERAHIDAIIENYQRKKRRRRIIALSVAVIVLAAIFIAWKIIVRPPTPVNPTPTPSSAVTPNPSVKPTEKPVVTYTRKDGFYTFAILGKDYEADLTDTILVGALDTVNGKLNVVSIPRDTLVNVSRSYKKINGLYSHNGYNMDKAREELKSLLGFTVDSYVVVDIEAFEKIVDTIGGVWFNVPVNMDYDDPVQDFHIHLEAGYQHLDGKNALGVVRFRQNNENSPYGPGYLGADIDRIATQQAFMKELAKQCLQIGNAAKVNEFAQIWKDYVITDLSVGNMVWYGLELLKLDSSSIDFMTLPADYNDYAFGMSCCVIKLDEWLEMVNTRLSPYKEEITEDVLNIITRDEYGNLYATSGVILGD